MEKHPKRIAADGELELPEEIMQHIIQSFMSEREAARTTLVSKSWYGAWSTRPNLSFDQYELRNWLPQLATKTLQRYEDLNLKIHTLRLQMYRDESVARELVLKAIKLGAVDLTIDIHSRIFGAFVLPDEVLESQTLARLSAHRITLDLETRNKPLTSSNLKSLTLYSTVTKVDFSYLSRRFPLLEELTVEACPNLCLPFYGCTTKLNKLKILQLVRLDMQDSLSKSDLWLQFPCLKTLVIRNCYFGEDVIRICSPSLECLTISFSWYTNAKLELDVPHIRKFEFKCYDVPRLELKTTSREWESDIRITCLAYIGSALWLRSLKQFVKLLSPSRVSLALYMSNRPQFGAEDGFVGDDLAIRAVENLTIRGYRVAPAFLNNLFRTCGPNLVNIQRRCVLGIEKENVEQFQHLSSLPWNTLLNHSEEEFVRFQLK